MFQFKSLRPFAQCLSAKSPKASIEYISLTTAATATALSFYGNLILSAPIAAASPRGAFPSIEQTKGQAITQLEEGIHLLGEAPQRGQLGVTYIALEISNQQAVGAIYTPFSSFDCFYGEVTPSHLNLTVVNSYDQTQHSHTVPLTIEDNLMAGPITVTTGPTGLYRLSTLTDEEYSFLDTCKLLYENAV